MLKKSSKKKRSPPPPSLQRTRKKSKSKIGAKKKRKILIKKNNKKGQAVNEKSTAELQFRGIKIKVVGIGGGGSSIVSEIAPKIKRVRFLAANTDWQALKSTVKGAERFQFGKDLTRGLGTGMDSQLGETAAQNDKERIKKIFQEEDFSILVSTLGGGVGSGASPVFAKAARDSKSLTLGIFTFPFEFEGKKRKEIADASLAKLKPELNAYILIPNDKIFQIIDQKTPLKEALSAMNKILSENLEGLIEMVHSPGLINIDFADLRTALEGKGRLAYLSTAEVQGDNRAGAGISKLLQNPLYKYGISGAERIIFNITGSKNLTITEVEKISKSISNFNPKAKIIFGLSQRDDYHDKIKITLLAVGCAKKDTAKLGDGNQKINSLKKRKENSSGRKNLRLKNKAKKEKKNNLLQDDKPKERKITIKVGKTALDLKKELDKAEKEIVSKESELDAPAFLRKKFLRLR